MVRSLYVNYKYKGKWTMVYDEGFIVELNDFSFFPFCKYKIDSNNGSKKFISQCFTTCLGCKQ